MLNPIFSNSNKKNKNFTNKIIFPSSNLNKIEKPEKVNSPQKGNKSNKLYNLGIAITSPNLIKNSNETEIEQISITANEKNKYKKYVKKLNMKTQIEEKDKPNKLTKKRFNIYNENNNNIENQSAITLSNSNAYLYNLNNIHINTPKKAMIKYYLSPKCNNSQVFNNFYSINMPGNVNAPVKVINVIKK